MSKARKNRKKSEKKIKKIHFKIFINHHSSFAEKLY